MIEAEVHEAEANKAEAVADSIAAKKTAAGIWAQSLFSRLGSGLGKSGGVQDPDSAASATPPEQAATERAEVTLDRAGERLGLFAASLSHQVRRSTALVREEAEDILAEAQSLRQKDQA